MMIREKLFIITSLFFFIAGIIVILASLLFHLNKAHIGLAFALPPLVYTASRRRVRKNQEIGYESNLTARFLLIMFVLFASLALLEWRQQIYQRSIIFFILIACAYLTIITQILFSPSRRYTFSILLQIFAVAIIVRGSIYFNFPTVYGHDPFFHISCTEQTISSGFLSPQLERYIGFPYKYLFTATVSQVLGIELKIAYFMSSITEVLTALFVFVTGRMVAGEKIGLLGTAIISVSPYNIYWGFWITPMTLSLGFFMIIIYLVAKIRFNHSRKIIGLLIFFLLSSILVHPVVSFVTWVILLSIPISLIAYKRFLQPSENVTITLGLILLFASAMFSHWMYIYSLEGDFFSQLAGSMITSLRRIGTVPVTVVTLAPMFEYSSILLCDLPFTLLLFFGILGSLFISDDKPDALKFALAFLPVFLIVMIYCAGFLGISALLPARWFPFVEVLLALLASYGAHFLISAAKGFNGRLILSCILFFLFVFSAITSPITNGDSAFYAKEMSRRAALIDSEVTAAIFIGAHYEGPISGHAYHLENGEILNPSDSSTYEGKMIIVRNYDIEKGIDIPLFGAKGKLLEIVFPDQHFFDFISRYNLVYNNGEVRAHVPS